jgi:hypothetical protein
MRVICLGCVKITDLQISAHWVLVKKDLAVNCYRGICDRCGREMILQDIVAVDTAILNRGRKT